MFNVILIIMSRRSTYSFLQTYLSKRYTKEMTSAAIRIFKQLKLENEDLKALLLKLTAKYKYSEVKRTVLLRRNALLIADNRNLHKQLLEAEKNRLVAETTIQNYHEVLKKMQKELKEIKEIKLSGGDHTDVKSQSDKSVSCTNLQDDKLPVPEESAQYFELSEDSLSQRNIQKDKKKKSKNVLDKMSQSSCTRTSEEALDGAPEVFYKKEANSPTYTSVPEMNAYYLTEDEQTQSDNPTEDFSKTIETTIVSDGEKEDMQKHFERERTLWLRIKELKELSKAREKELETRRFAVAAKTEMVQNAQKEIRRIQRLIALTKH